ncbi:Aspartate/glutamate/uridylate kinase [Multifurca ochricompacta]|uniref:Aspartate/glutamate/uridylate kinase n=1 Tax=Multifurca ochricompacta TaxID=376703 RepID=A0AAD4M6A6_9AGAM|nr:Aspartate/glutamate/uridylate kinase [Multifurca ochricompacta]
MARTKLLTIVVKLGTSSIVHETTHQPLLSTLSAVVETVVLVLISSGAIGVGLQRMAMSTRPKSLSGKQALAAIGQGRLIALWDNLFGQLGQPIAQVLLTRGDISDRTRYLNAVNTFKELLSMGVIPIVNENDTVSVSEIKFGDNDTLSAITSSMIHADYLFLFTDVDGLYTANPRKDLSARLIEVVESTAAIRSQVSTATLGSSLGTGGMETKLIAAEIATAAGVTTIITSSRNPASLFAILEYHGAASGSSSRPTIRPPHTVFTPSVIPSRDLKAWTRHTLTPAGAVVIDSGAHVVLSRRESGGRLLAAGVLASAVRILVRKKAVRVRAGLAPTQPGTPRGTETVAEPAWVQQGAGSDALALAEDVVTAVLEKEVVDDGDGQCESELEEVGRGLANYNSAEIEKVKGLNRYTEYVVENVTIFVRP